MSVGEAFSSGITETGNFALRYWAIILFFICIFTFCGVSYLVFNSLFGG